MNSLSILESIYSGEPYPVAEKVMVDPSEVNLSFKYKSMRFPNRTKSIVKLEQEPYTISFDRYLDMLKRTSLQVGERSPIELSLYSGPEEFEQFIIKYDEAHTTLKEPFSITDLMYDSKCLSPLGIMALLFRRCYGSEEFRRYVNSTLLKEYRKEKVLDRGVNRTFYVKDNYQKRIDEVLELEKYIVPNDFDKVSDFLVQSPYVFIWRD